MKSKSILVLVIALIALVNVNYCIAIKYEIISLGNGDAYGVNNKGQVVGHFGLWENGITTDIGIDVAEAINNSGRVVGWGYPVGGWPRALLYENGQTNIIDNTHTESKAFGINNNGLVVGYFGDDFGGEYTHHAFLYDSANIIDLDPLGGTSYAHGINASGQIAGSQNGRAFIYEDRILTDIGTLGGQNSYGYAINDNGQIVGRAATENGDLHAFLYSDGTMLDLGVLSGNGQSRADAINNNGQVVGYSNYIGGGSTDYHAFLWQDGLLTDLNELLPPDSGWELYRAFGINDSGWIVGEGSNGAFLLTPEPTTLLLLGLGAVILTRKRRTLD